MRILLVVCALAIAHVGVARADAPDLTHTSPLTPTGELVPEGHFHRTQSLVAFYHELAVGLTDGLELRLGMPGLPLPILGGDLQLSASVLPRASRLRVVIGTGVAAEWINGGDVWLGVSSTVGWRGDGWGAHATLRALEHRVGGDGEDLGDRLGTASVGISVRAGSIATVIVEAGELAWQDPAMCTARKGEAVDCGDHWSARGVMLGVWWKLKDMSIGASGILVRSGDHVIPVLPLLSFGWDKERVFSRLTRVATGCIGCGFDGGTGSAVEAGDVVGYTVGWYTRRLERLRAP